MTPPYTAASIREFWRRWHISLTSWLTDYLYIPLGGSRCGKLRHCVNILAVFLASGLWHGANWTFVVWGGLHGAALVAETLLPARLRLPRRLGQGLTFAFVCFAWIFFRADTVGQALQLIAAPAHRLAHPARPGPDMARPAPAGAGGSSAGAAAALARPRHPSPAGGCGGILPHRRRGAGLAVLLAAGAGNAFIYFQF